MPTDLVPSSNGNGHHHVAELTTVCVPAYRPTPRDWRFLTAVQEAIAADGRLSHEAIANRVKMTRQGVWKRFQDEAFCAWLNAQVATAVDDAWPKVLMRATTLALRGSIDHMNFLAKVGGKFQHIDTPTAPGTTIINGNVQQTLTPILIRVVDDVECQNGHGTIPAP
jgi:hypothetical protein